MIEHTSTPKGNFSLHEITKKWLLQILKNFSSLIFKYEITFLKAEILLYKYWSHCIKKKAWLGGCVTS